MFRIRLLALTIAAVTVAARAEGPTVRSVWPSTSSQVGLYEKFELRIDLDAKYSNPFDPQQIDVQAEFISPSGKDLT